MGTRGHFVDEEPAVFHQKQFDAEDADAIQRINHRAGQRGGLPGNFRVDRSRHAGRPENAGLVDVFHHRIEPAVPVRTTDHQHGQFFLKRQKLLDDPAVLRVRAKFALHAADILGTGQPPLALAVIAQRGRLAQRRKADRVGNRQLIRRQHRLERRDGNLLRGEEGFLCKPVLDDL